MSATKTPPHYNVPGQGVFGFIADVLNRDSDVETPAQAFMRGNVLKYVVRAPRKNGAEDYRKAIDYLNRLLVDMREAEQ